MSDSIKKDDEKFAELITKQHPTFESFSESQPKSDNVIEQDDAKIDDYLLYQELNEEVKYDSLEQKYEEHILIEQVTKLLDNHRLSNFEDGNPFEQFFLTEEDERC